MRRLLVVAAMNAAGVAAFMNHVAPRDLRITRTSHGFAMPAVRLASAQAAVGTRRASPQHISMALVEDPCSPEKAAALIGKAKAVVDADMALRDASLLADDFKFVRAFQAPLDKAAYLCEYSSYGLREAFPDLFWNAHDFRMERYDSNRVVATVRFQGTHRGTLKYRKREFPATQTRVEGSPECMTFVFDPESGLCTRMTGGFCMDRSTGATGVAGGIWGVLNAIGSPVSPWLYYPPFKVVTSVFARSFKPSSGSGLREAPLDETLMVAIAKQVAEGLFRDSATTGELMADDFVFVAPIVGPLKKKAFLSSLDQFRLVEAVPDLKFNTYDHRVDKFDPARVWYTSRATGTNTGILQVGSLEVQPTNKTFEAGPETVSLTFNKQGFITKLTTGYVMDPELGTTNGIGAVFGILEGIGRPLPSWNTRAVPEAVRLFVDALKPAPKPKATKKLSVAAAIKAPAVAMGKAAASAAPMALKGAAPKVAAPKVLAKPATVAKAAVTSKVPPRDAANLKSSSPPPRGRPAAAVAKPESAAPAPLQAPPAAPVASVAALRAAKRAEMGTRVLPVRSVPPAPKAPPAPVAAEAAAPPKIAAAPAKAPTGAAAAAKAPAASKAPSGGLFGGFLGIRKPASPKQAAKPAGAKTPTKPR